MDLNIGTGRAGVKSLSGREADMDRVFFHDSYIPVSSFQLSSLSDIPSGMVLCL